jgi:signal transduction histidine kinase
MQIRPRAAVPRRAPGTVGEVSLPDSTVTSLPGLLDLQHANHLCLVYERAAEARAAVVAFFNAGLAAGDRCLYGGGANWRRIERTLAMGLHAPAIAGRNGGPAVLGEIRPPRGSGLEAWLDLVLDAERQALADGFPGLRVSWEMPPAPELRRLADLGEMEETLDRALAGSRVVLLCRYSRQRSPAALLQQVMHSHPVAILGGEVGANVFYEPAPDAAAGVDSEERVDRMLAQVRRELRRDRRLRELERRLADRAIELERADQDREQLIAMLAHELRNPLSTVSIALSVLRLRGGAAETDETWKRALDTAERQVHHQAALVDDLLEAARVTRGEIDLHREPLDLAWLVPEVVDAHREDFREAGLALDLELTREPLPVSGDRLRLWQAVAHLLQNAVKFSPPGSWVKVRLGRAAGGRAEISVRDSGIGISPDLLPHVFEAFTQADHTLDRAKGGLGVGLALVKGVIELHGGEVEARSEGKSGKGSEFKLLLPLDPAAGDDAGADLLAATAATATAAGGQLPAPGESSRRVLVVEDNLDTAETLRDLLELSGFEVAVAASGSEGVSAAHEFRPEVVLCDLGLPGMNGFEVATALRQDPTTASARLIALTGYGGDEDRRRSREAGFDIHLTKPVEPSLLRRLLQPDRAPTP